MTEDSQQADKPAADTPEDPAPKATTKPLRLSVIGFTVVPLGLVAIGIILFIGVFDGPAWLRTLTARPLAPVSGQVLFNGKPLGNVEVMTQPTEPGMRAAVGFPVMNGEDDGRFVLKTDINGTYQDGIQVGEHKVTIAVHLVSNAPTAPPLLTPEIYASFATTPLRINVPKSGLVDYEIKIEGEVIDVEALQRRRSEAARAARAYAARRSQQESGGEESNDGQPSRSDEEAPNDDEAEGDSEAL
jgi:hypothetical protein